MTGLSNLVLEVGFEPTRAITPTRPSTLRVYQFHHPSDVRKEDVEDTDAPKGVQAVNLKSSAVFDGAVPNSGIYSFMHPKASQMGGSGLGCNP